LAASTAWEGGSSVGAAAVEGISRMATAMAASTATLASHQINREELRFSLMGVLLFA